MSKVLLVFDGGSRGNPGAGYGSYAIVRDQRRRVTRLEFGEGMTSHEAEYDTLITALLALSRRENPAEITLTIQAASQLVVRQIKGTWKVNTSRLDARCSRARELLHKFHSFTLARTPREQIKRLLRE